MMRTLRRALRQWKREFLAFWGRFTAFHRIVIGILLAMGIVFLARTRVIDPLERDLATERKTLADKGVPARVPAPEEDEDIQEETLRAENLQRSLKKRTAELKAAEASSPYRLDAGKADASAALLALAGRHGLHVLKNAPTAAEAGPVPTAAEASPVPTAAAAYELAGRFASIYGFLDDARREPLLWELRDVSIALANESDAFGGSGAPPLVLRFTLVLHLYRGGGA
jgi:hypothetical protein